MLNRESEPKGHQKPSADFKRTGFRTLFAILIFAIFCSECARVLLPVWWCGRGDGDEGSGHPEVQRIRVHHILYAPQVSFAVWDRCFRVKEKEKVPGWGDENFKIVGRYVHAVMRSRLVPPFLGRIRSRIRFFVRSELRFEVLFYLWTSIKLIPVKLNMMNKFC